MLKRLLLLIVPVIVLIGWLMARGTPPPEVGWTQPKHEPIVSTLTTNGRVDPSEWAAVTSETAGPVLSVPVQRGASVRKGQVIATISSAQAQNDMSSAQSRVNAAQAELETIKSGGRAVEIADIESGLQRARTDLATAQREAATLERLVAKKAATDAELTAARNAVRQAQQQIDSFERRRSALVTPPDRRAAEAKLAEAQAGVAAAGRKISEAQIRTPIDGVLYALDIRAGGYVEPGAPLGRVGKLDRMRVTVYVDEPELGRVSQGMPVTITWDALPGREWKGTVESVPLQVVPVGTRQVGEVICIIENPDHSLIAGTNINAEIRSKSIPSALTVPKEVLRREGGETGVLKIVDDKLVWQKVKTGIASVTRIQIVEGLTESDKVALPTEAPVRAGDKVRPVSRST